MKKTILVMLVMGIAFLGISQGTEAKRGNGKGQGNQDYSSSNEKQRENRPHPMMFSDFDNNQDNFISEKEFGAAQAKRVTKNANEKRQLKNINNRASFEDMDKNGDRKITTTEFDEYCKERAKNMQEKRGQAKK